MLQPNEIVGVMHAAQCCCSDVARDCVEFVSSRQGMSVACDDDIDDVRNELVLFRLGIRVRSFSNRPIRDDMDAFRLKLFAYPRQPFLLILQSATATKCLARSRHTAAN